MRPHDWAFYQYFNAYSNKNASLQIPQSQSLLLPMCDPGKSVMAAKVTVGAHHSSYLICTPWLPGEHNAHFFVAEFITAARASQTAYRQQQVIA